MLLEEKKKKKKTLCEMYVMSVIALKVNKEKKLF